MAHNGVSFSMFSTRALVFKFCLMNTHIVYIHNYRHKPWEHPLPIENGIKLPKNSQSKINYSSGWQVGQITKYSSKRTRYCDRGGGEHKMDSGVSHITYHTTQDSFHASSKPIKKANISQVLCLRCNFGNNKIASSGREAEWYFYTIILS